MYLMPYGDPLSQIGTTKGIAAQLHLGYSRPVEGQDEQAGRTTSGNAVVAVPSRPREKSQAQPIRIDYTSSSGVTTYGMDPMVSQASVIHELAYGRINTIASKAATGTGYPIPRDMTMHDLDLFV